jgi:hypothetical protein
MRAVRERFGASSVEHWATLRAYCDGGSPGRNRLEAALGYFDAQRALPAVRELQPWIERMR